MYLIILLCLHLIISILMYIKNFQELKSIKLTFKKEQGRLKFDLLFLFKKRGQSPFLQSPFLQNI